MEEVGNFFLKKMSETYHMSLRVYDRSLTERQPTDTFFTDTTTQRKTISRQTTHGQNMINTDGHRKR